METLGIRIPDPITSPDLPENTLDEPVYLTIWRDLKLIGIKTFHVLVPTGRGPAVLRDWDLWGPLIYCFLFSMFVSLAHSSKSGSSDNQSSAIYTGCFCIIWLGCAFITLNAKLLRSRTSFWQALSVLGYCIFPLMIAAFMVIFWSNLIYRLVSVVVAVIWSSWATVAFFGAMASFRKRPLVVFPVLLFYMVLGWVVLVVGV